MEFAAVYCVRGPRYVIAQDSISSPYVEIIDNTQLVARLMELIDLCIGFRNHGYSIKRPNNF